MAPDGLLNAVTLGTLMRVCADLHGVTEERFPALKGRFRNFLKMGFPDVRGAGTGRRAEYWPEHVAQVLVAFELLRFRIPQSAAAIGVSGSAATVLEVFGRASRKALGVPEQGAVLLSVTSNALIEDAKRADLADLSIIAVPGPAGERRYSSSTSLVVDVPSLLRRSIAAAAHTDEPFELQFFAALPVAPRT
jgi:hypothetical protein